MLACLMAALAGGCAASETVPLPGSGLTVLSLQALSVTQLRGRRYGTRIQDAKPIGEARSNTYVAVYESDGVEVMTRIDVPQAQSEETALPVLVLLHGWVGIDAAPAFDFYSGGGSWYSDLIQRYVDE